MLNGLVQVDLLEVLGLDEDGKLNQLEGGGFGNIK
jgi:hypothetical protein